MTLISSAMLGRRLVDALGLADQNVTSITIRCDIGKTVPSVTVETLMRVDDADDLTAVLTDYDLIARPTPEEAK